MPPPRIATLPLTAAVALAAASALTAAPRRARADGSGRPIVIESWVAQRPADAGKLLGPVYSELAAGGFPQPAQVAFRVATGLSRPGRAGTDAQVTAALDAIDAGYRDYTGGRFQTAIDELSRGLRQLRASPAALVGNAGRRQQILRGLVGLAMANKRLGHSAEATAAMAELIRSFPDRDISYKDYGPEPRDLYQEVKHDLAHQGLGSLSIDVDDDRTVVFLDEHYVGVGDVNLAGLPPGRYRAFVQQGEHTGRVHEVNVEPGEAAALTVSWQLDATLHSTGGHASMVFADDDSRRDSEALYAVRVARALGAPSVVVLGIHDNRGRRSVIGAVYSVDSTRPLRSGAVAVEPVEPEPARLQALGRLLAGDEAAARLVATVGDLGGAGAGGAAGPAPGDSDTGGRPLRAWKWVTLGGGLAAVATGVTLIIIDRPATLDDGSRNPFARNTKPAGIVTTAAGAALTGLGVYFFVRDHQDQGQGRERPAATAAVVPTAGGLALTVLGRF